MYPFYFIEHVSSVHWIYGFVPILLHGSPQVVFGKSFKAHHHSDTVWIIGISSLVF